MQDSREKKQKATHTNPPLFCWIRWILSGLMRILFSPIIDFNHEIKLIGNAYRTVKYSSTPYNVHHFGLLNIIYSLILELTITTAANSKVNNAYWTSLWMCVCVTNTKSSARDIFRILWNVRSWPRAVSYTFAIYAINTDVTLSIDRSDFLPDQTHLIRWTCRALCINLIVWISSFKSCYQPIRRVCFVQVFPLQNRLRESKNV